MIINSSIVGIIADDLTGANDTALQFKLNGTDTNILLKNEIAKSQKAEFGAQAWAISTESRNVSAKEAFEKVKDAVQLLEKEINPDYFYKKIDSTVRGNIAVEVLSILEVLGWDAAVIMPAFPQEGRITVGGYQLLKGVPIERTEMARDPHSPINESHLPKLLKNQLGENLENIVGMIELSTILDGAGPIVVKLNELIAKGKKIIVTDSASTTDIEQVVLAMNKSGYKILPVGNAAAAKVLSNEWFPLQERNEEVLPVKLPKLPKFIVSGSATQITANQIEKFEQSEDYEENALAIELNMNTVLLGVQDELVDRIVSNLGDDNIVLVHTSKLIKNFDGFNEDAVKANLTKSGLANVITDFLAELTKKVLAKKKAVLITLGGETSYKCCDAIEANQLKLVDEVLPAIALSKSFNSDQWIVTKSGNLGGLNTIIEILKYFDRHETNE
ncbi:four-carbon acid sugar kinase family protein [bacterium]|nr:four-carbon acid sugar kinase family protein [bacterium]